MFSIKWEEMTLVEFIEINQQTHSNIFLYVLKIFTLYIMLNKVFLKHTDVSQNIIELKSWWRKFLILLLNITS